MSDEDDLVDKLVAKDSWKEFDLITYSRRKESKGINKQTFTFSRNRKNTAPYWVIGILGGMAILLYFVSLWMPQRSESSVQVESKIQMEDNYGTK